MILARYERASEVTHAPLPGPPQVDPRLPDFKTTHIASCPTVTPLSSNMMASHRLSTPAGCDAFPPAAPSSCRRQSVVRIRIRRLSPSVAGSHRRRASRTAHEAAEACPAPLGAPALFVGPYTGASVRPRVTARVGTHPPGHRQPSCPQHQPTDMRCCPVLDVHGAAAAGPSISAPTQRRPAGAHQAQGEGPGHRSGSLLEEGPEVSEAEGDELYMAQAIEEGKKAAANGEVPVGAVLVIGGQVVARGHNCVEITKDPTAHAEMVCIRQAAADAGAWRLTSATLYVTLEPCPMCAGAALQARVDAVVYGAPNPLLGAHGSWVQVLPIQFPDSDATPGVPSSRPHAFHPDIKVRQGVLAEDCAELMRSFFRRRRKAAKQSK